MREPFLPLQTPAAGVPAHLALIMDGNGRWAQQRWLPRVAGHKEGVASLRRLVRACLERGVAVLTVFAFSSENWRRPEEEVSGLMSLLLLALGREVSELKANGVRLYVVGERHKLSPQLVQKLQAAEQETAGCRRLALNVCFNYGGRWDIAQAAQWLVQQGLPISEHSLSQASALAHVGDPDLLIRTGGERRLSNFLLWQSAYTELYFTDCLWPDFGAAELERALQDYARRQRRFGQTAEQCAGAAPSIPAGSVHA